MNLKKVYLFNSKQLSTVLSEWGSSLGAEIILREYNDKLEFDEFDGLVALTEGLDVEKADQDLIDEFDARRIPIRKIDLNGTIQVAVNGLDLWLKNNKCTRISIIGSDHLMKNDNLNRFLNRMLEIAG